MIYNPDKKNKMQRHVYKRLEKYLAQWNMRNRIVILLSWLMYSDYLMLAWLFQDFNRLFHEAKFLLLKLMDDQMIKLWKKQN